MEVLHFVSTDGVVEIKAVTVANLNWLWQRFASRVANDKARKYCDYASTLQGSLKLELPITLEKPLEKDTMEWKSLPPVFYETTTYNFTLRFKGLAESPLVLHKLKEVRDLFTLVDTNKDSGDYIITAPLSFLNEPGLFNLSFRYTLKSGKTKTDTLSFRVVSPKLDTKDDYMHILNEINAEYNEIVYQYLTKTVQNLSRGGRTSNDIVWLSIFKNVVENYIKAVNYIVNRPHLRKTKEVHYSKADRIKRWTPQMARQYVQSEKQETLDKDYFRHELTINTHDTRENRFVKFSLDRISHRLERVFARLKQNDEITVEELETLENYNNKLRKFSNSPLFRSLKAEPLRSESMVLQKRSGYAQVYRYWLMLQKGIELYEGSTQIGVRPVWELYELWCFLKMRKMVADILGLQFGNADDITETPMPMIEPFAENTREHTVYYHRGNETVRLHYQHTYNRTSGDVHTATTDNRPDIVLTVQKPDGFELTYLFDAKYRVCDDSEFTKSDKDEINTLKAADYPPTDAINQMHRYRDAIYYGDEINNVRQHSAKEIIGGYILFPGRSDDETIRERYFYKSIETVNIGAFPLLPDHTDPKNEGTLLYNHLKKILIEQSAYEQIRDSIPQHGLVYSPIVADSNELILVGYCKAGYKDIYLNNKLYYVPAGLGKGSINIVSGFEHTKYLLLHHDKERLLLELSANGPKFYTAKTLQGMGFQPSGEYYLGFEIKSTNPIEIEELDIAALDLRDKGKQSFRPYFTTIKKLKEGKI